MSRNMLTTYRGLAGDVGMLLIEVFLKLGQLVQVPLLLPQPIARIAELSSTSTTVATKARRTTAIAEKK